MNAVAKRPRFSRWRRLPGVYRFGEHKWPDPNQEPQRLTLYVTGEILDRAEAQALRLGYETAQEYCTELVVRAVEAERVREHVAEVEAKRGPLEGLHEIADDPEYLAELSGAAASPRDPPPLPPEAPTPSVQADGIIFPDDAPPHGTTAPEPPRSDALTPAARVVLRHAGQAEDDPFAFLPCLRRGEPVPPAAVAELGQALHDLEAEHRGAGAMDRRLGFALHRLAFESQILHTDAWPGAFDAWTVEMLRAVQEAVERLLSGQDIRYYPDDSEPAPTPETPR